jgi:hypothetical protein
LRTYYQKQVGLSAPEAAIVKQIAAANVAAVKQLDDRAQQIIRETRARHPNGRLAKGESPPSPPQELAQLEQQRDNVTNTHIENLKAALSTSVFKQLDDYLQTRFARNFSAVSPNGSKASTVPRPTFPVPSVPPTRKEGAR